MLEPPKAAWLFARGIEALAVETQSGSMRSTKARTREARSRPQPTIAACRRTDVLALTKLSYNTDTFGDRIPVTLRFAEAAREMLAAAPRKNELSPLPFRYCI